MISYARWIDVPIMALWISHLVLLMKELMGRRTSSGIPTEMNARRLSSALDYDSADS
jgi:hypothetical protein